MIMNNDGIPITFESKSEKNLKYEFVFYGKLFIIFSIAFSSIWLIGYFQINILWGIIGIMTYVVYQATINRQRQKFQFGLQLSSDIKYTIDNLQDLPSWVSFPDVERVEWINKIILRLWPNIAAYLNKVVPDIILRKLKKKLKGVKLKDIDFGDISPKIGGVKLYDSENISRDEIIMDVEIYYFSPAEITILYNQLPFGIKSFEIKANLRIQLNSLIPHIPFFGSISLSFLQPPVINFEFTDMVSILNMPGIKLLLKEAIDDVFSDIMVLPNRINITLVKDIKLLKYMIHVPDGLIRMNVIEAADLKAMDVNIFGAKSSDPYIIIRIGAEKFKTKVIDNCLNPKWNETFEAIVDTKLCQKIELELFDKDKNNKDDFLGRVSFDAEGVYERGIYDAWLPLTDVSTGSVHLNLTWLDLSSDPNVFELEEERSKCSEIRFNVGLLCLSLDSAKNLFKPGGSEDPDPVVKISLGNQTKTSSIKKRTVNPIWQDEFYFLIQSLISSEINIQVKDDKLKKILGNCTFKIEKLINEPSMESFVTLKLENTNGSGSTIQLFMKLRALLPKRTRTRTTTRLSSFKISNKNSSQDANSNGLLLQSIKDDYTEDVFESPKETYPESSMNNNISDSKQLSNSPDGLAKVNLTLRYTNNKNLLIVALHKVMNIKTDHNVYVKLWILPKDSRSTKHRTKSHVNQKMLVYDETFEFFLSKDILQNSELVLHFKEERRSVIKRNPTIGKTNIDLNDFNPNNIKSDWFSIKIKPNNRNSDTFSLLSSQSETLINT